MEHDRSWHRPAARVRAALALVLLLLATAAPAQQKLRYAFEGVLDAAFGTLPAGTALSGTVLFPLPQTGSDAGLSGSFLAYDLERITLSAATDTIVAGARAGGAVIGVTGTTSNASAEFHIRSPDLTGLAQPAALGGQLLREFELSFVRFNSQLFASGELPGSGERPGSGEFFNVMNERDLRLFMVGTTDSGSATLTAFEVTLVPLPAALLPTALALGVLARRRRRG